MSEHSNSLLSQILAEQVKQTELLRMMAEQQAVLIQELAGSEEDDPDAEPATYMDGSPCR